MLRFLSSKDLRCREQLSCSGSLDSTEVSSKYEQIWCDICPLILILLHDSQRPVIYNTFLINDQCLKDFTGNNSCCKVILSWHLKKIQPILSATSFLQGTYGLRIFHLKGI